MEEMFLNSNLLKCKHSEMLNELIGIYMKVDGINKDSFAEIATKTIDFISQRVKDEDLKISYKAFLVESIVLDAFCVIISREKKPVQDHDDFEEGLINIPVEEFEDTPIDEEFDKLVGWND
jgi:hypothetical protein